MYALSLIYSVANPPALGVVGQIKSTRMKELDRGGHIIQYIQMTQKINRSKDTPETP